MFINFLLIPILFSINSSRCDINLFAITIFLNTKNKNMNLNIQEEEICSIYNSKNSIKEKNLFLLQTISFNIENFLHNEEKTPQEYLGSNILNNIEINRIIFDNVEKVIMNDIDKVTVKYIFSSPYRKNKIEYSIVCKKNYNDLHNDEIEEFREERNEDLATFITDYIVFNHKYTYIKKFESIPAIQL